MLWISTAVRQPSTEEERGGSRGAQKSIYQQLFITLRAVHAGFVADLDISVTYICI